MARPLYPHVTKSVQKLKVTALSAASERMCAERTATAEDERTILAAQDVIRQLRQLQPQLQKIYDRVKYSMPTWGEGPRDTAAKLTNSCGELEGVLSDKITSLRRRR